jgi:hypothetical protein
MLWIEVDSGGRRVAIGISPTSQALSAGNQKKQIVYVTQLRKFRVGATLQSCLKIATRHPLLPHLATNQRHATAPPHL